MIPPIVLLVAFSGIFVTLAIGIILGPISKKFAYSMGMLGAGLGVLVSLLVLLGVGTVSIDLWQLTLTSSAQLQLSQFNSYFLLVSSLVWVGTCLFSITYDDYPNALSSLILLTILSMLVILVSGDAITFLIGWETMTIASFFMILEGKGSHEGVRHAAYLFLAFGEGSTVFIMLAFSGISSSVGNFDFLGPSSTSAIGPIGSLVFVTALIGFGLKMGIVPFHMSEWLPIAHSSAPSNASALLSATLTLMGVYGFMTVIARFAHIELWWGWLALVVGGISTLLGAMFSSVSEHSKGLPAYSTIENNGLIVVAIGAYLVASYYRITLLADFAMIAALFHAFSHSISKASLFLTNGWISKIKKSFDLNNSEKVSGTGVSSTRLAGLFTVLSLSAAPPLAGFVSEWMVLELLFQSFKFGDLASQIIGTLVGGITALAAGVIIVAMTKVYGFGVLWSVRAGKPKENSQDSLIVGSLVWFLIIIVAVGAAAPAIFLLASNAASQILQTHAFDTFVTGLLGVPAYFVILSGNPFGGFSPTFTAIFLLAFLSIPAIISTYGSPWRVRRTGGWFAGNAQPTSPSELYNSFGYSIPIRIMFRFLFRTKESVVQVGATWRTMILLPEEYVVELEVVDIFKELYDVAAKWALWLSSYLSRKVMPGRLSLYMVYVMAALIFVLIYILFTVG